MAERDGCERDESGDLQDAAFSWLKKGCYRKAVKGFQLITRTKLKLNHVQCDQFNETLCILGKLRRGLAETLWHMGRFDHALKEIQLCTTENCHEFSEESMSHWTMLADQRWDRLTGDKQTAIIGYEIACHFIPSHDVLKRSHLLSKMLVMCIDAGNVRHFQKKAAELLIVASQMKACESQEIVKIWMDCGKRLLSWKAYASISIECFTLAQTFLPSNDSGKLKARISYYRASAILTANESTQFGQAIKDANAYVEQCPMSVKGYRLLWKCCLGAHNYDDALAAFRNTQEILTDKQEDQYKEFFQFFTTAISQKAFEIFKAECPVPKSFVQRLIIDPVVKRDVRNLSVLFCEGWAADCDASCVPLDLVLASEVINHEQLVTILLQQNAHAKGLPESSKSPLSVCLEMNKLDLAVTLLQHGADENDLMERDGETPFHASLRIGLKKENLAIFQFFLDSKRYPIDLQDKDKNTLLHFLCRGKIDSKKNEAMIILLEAGANPLITNNEMKTPFDIASNLWDKRRNLLSSAVERFTHPPPYDQDTAKLEIKTKLDAEAKGERISPEQSNTSSPSSSSATPSSSMPSSKSDNSRKESLSDVFKRIQSLIKRLDVPAGFQKVASHEKPRKVSTRTETPDLQNDQKQSNVVKETSGIAKESEGNSCRSNDDTDAVVCDKLEEAFKGLPWEVVFTDKVRKILHDRRLEWAKKKLFLEKVTKLAQGRDNWTVHLRKRLEGLPKSRGMLLYETRLTDAARIIWECAVAFSPYYSDKQPENKTTYYSEIIRIWDIVFDHDKVPHAIKNIVTSFTRGQNCLLKKELRGLPRVDASQNQGPNLYVKRTQTNVPPLPSVTKLQEDETVKDEADDDQVTFGPPASPYDNEYQLLKFYTLSPAMIRTILKQQPCSVEVDFPFRVREEEHEIINFEPSPQSSIILIGRSGTGKTTCILYRLWKDFLTYWQKAEKSGPLLPKGMVFFSKDNLDSNSSNFEEGTFAGGSSRQSDETHCGAESRARQGDECKAATGCPAKPVVSTGSESEESLEHLHQLFVTKNGVLCQEIQKNFIGLSQACAFIKHESELRKAPMKLQEVDDSATGWPLFLNARDLYVILDASLPKPYFFPRNKDGSLETRVQNWGEEDSQLCIIPIIDDDEGAEDEDPEDDTDEEDEDQTTEGSAYGCEQRQSVVFVSYTTFENQLWPKMCKKKKRTDFHPSLVWMEIRSVIKGSYEALHAKNGHLSLESYKKIGQKMAPNFIADREAIYKLFVSYERVKRSCNMFDENDLVFDLYHRLRECKATDWSIHNLYVDETQDFTQAELMLLIRCCRDPNGVFLTGDTAQSVMRGISFRFEDLRSLFFHLKESYKAVGVQVEVPEIMPLIYNYRSHNGILNLASSVVNLLQKYFPESFDKLPIDQGHEDGPKPVLLGSCSQMDLAILLRGNKRKTTTAIEFGAHQVILVASNEARERLPEELSHALVLTIYEAKGLEFDDVLVYNFFKDSQARKEWRIVTQYLLEVLDCESVDNANVESRPLSFNPDKHKILNSELKQLYTAVTRARAKVWFFDEDEDNRRPVFEYFEQLGLADVVRLEAGTGKSSHGTQSLENMFSKESSVEEWEKQGAFFYSKKLWKVAENCFTISGNAEMSQRCKAYVQADHARSLHTEPRRLKDEFLRAADQFLQCNMIKEASVCLYNAQEYTLYASLCQKLKKTKTAARWFEKGCNFLEASQCLEQLGDYNEAVEVLVRGNLYHIAIDVLKKFNRLPPVSPRQTVAPKRTLQELYLASAERHSKAGNIEKMKNSLQFIHSVEVRVEFLKKCNLVDDAAKELLKEDRGVEAAKIMKENGSFLVAAEYARSSGDSSLAADCIFAYVRSSPDISKKEQIERLEEAKKLYRKAKRMNSVGEVLLQQARLSRDRKKVDEAVRNFRDVQNTCGELECTELLWDLAGDEHGVPGVDTWITIKMVKTALHLIKSLNASNLNVMTQEQIERCEKHFGLHREADPSKRVVRCKEGDRFLLFVKGIKKRPAPGNKWQVDLYDARERIAEVLFHRVVKLIQHVRGFLHNTFVTHETCQQFLVGLPCKAESCQYQHKLPSQGSTDKLFGAILNEICLDAQANDFHRTKKKFGNKNAYLFQRQLESSNKEAFPSDNFASCEKLLAFIFPAIGQTSSIELKFCISQLRDKKRGFLKGRLFKFAEELSQKRGTRKEIVSGGDLFLAVSQILQLIGSPSKIELCISDAEKTFGKTCDIQKNKPISPVPVGVASEGDAQVTWFSRWWKESKLHLHVYGDILKAGDIAVRHFELMTAKQEKELPFLSPKNCLDILEYFTCAHLALFARLQQSLKSHYLVCLPASYISVISFWDSLNCTTTKHVRIYKAALMHKSHPSSIREVKQFLHDLVSLMLGGYSPHFNLLKRVFNNCFIESGETERALILVLTLLCNCGQSVPPDSQARLLQNLSNTELSSDVILPERIERCLNQVKQAKGIRKIVDILQDLLQERHEVLFDVYWKNVKKRLWLDKVNPSNYPSTFYADVLEGVDQKTQDLPAEEVLESGDVEDNLTAEFDQQLEEQQPRGDVDHTRNERLEAIEREEALQAESWEEEIAAEEARVKKILSEKEVVEEPFDDYFSAFRVDSSGCGICNVSFVTDESENVQYSLEDDQRQFEDNDSVASGHAEELIELSHQHVSSSVHFEEGSAHCKKKEQFEAYKKLFREEFSEYQIKQRNLLKEAENLLKARGSLTLLSNKVDQVKRADNVITEVTLRIQQERNWADLGSFKKAIMSLADALKACEEEIQLTKSGEADRRSSLLSFGSDALVWEKDPNIKDGTWAHVPGLKKKK